MATCETCTSWTRRNPDDMTAGEGKCNRESDPGVWPFYWPHTLRTDGCGEHTPASGDTQGEKD